MPILLHGDAAFSGQGIVPEVMELSELPDYTVGGCVHVVINNQIGFTTDPRQARTSYHCTNAAKGVGAPIFHVNGDDVDAVVSVCRLAATYRQTFGKDCVVDIVCYRRHGHNELDDPMITQPLTYKTIKQHPTTLQIYTKKLSAQGVSPKLFEKSSRNAFNSFEQDYERSKSHKVDPMEWLASNWQGKAMGSMIKDRPYNQTGVSAKMLLKVGYAICHIPEDMEVHPDVMNLMTARRRMLDTGKGFNMAFAEALSFGTLMTKYTPPGIPPGIPPGKDSVLSSLQPQSLKFIANGYNHNSTQNQQQQHRTAKVYYPLNNMSRVTNNSMSQRIDGGDGNHHHSGSSDSSHDSSHILEQASITICNSSLSETAVLGFEYGYSLSNEMALTVWEAQFGDFANVAQMIIDNFIVSGESKWTSNYSCSGLVMLLPHGYDGQGPEHSSARLERFLQLTDDDPDEIPGKGDATRAELIAGFDALDKFKQGRIAREDFRHFLISHAIVEETGHRVDLAIAELFSETGHEDEDYVSKEDWVSMMSAWIQRNSERQINIPYAKPLIVMSSKWLLHHKKCTSSIDEFLQGTFFHRLIVEGGRGDNIKIQRAIFCSGQETFSRNNF
eukprot:gene1311-2528_t